MKTNLKNFPVKGTSPMYEKWGKAFKKELEERTLELEKSKAPQWYYTIDILKEILGKNKEALAQCHS